MSDNRHQRTRGDRNRPNSGRHLRTIPHTGTRTLQTLMNESGMGYASHGHFTEQRAGLPIAWGLPTDIAIRHPVPTMISTIHHVLEGRIGMFRRLYDMRHRPNVNFIKIEDVDFVLESSRTPDHFGLRKRFVEDGEPFPEYFLSKLGDARIWLRDEFGYEDL